MPKCYQNKKKNKKQQPKLLNMTVTKHSKMMMNGTFNSPAKSPRKLSDRRRFQDELIHKCRTVSKVKTLNELNQEMFKDYGVYYTLEAIAHIILAKEIKTIKLWTPFGECQLLQLGQGKSNYIAKTGNKQLKYEEVIPNLQDETIIKNIQNFFVWDFPADFKINLKKSNLTLEINNNLKKFGQKTNNENAAVMCGIFIAEIVRTAGKVVRAAFVKEWPENASKLCEVFVQANKGGNAEIRNFIANPNSVDLDTIKTIERNVANFSPIKRKTHK